MKKKANCRLVNSIPKEVTILDEDNLTFLPKSIKNPVEVENERIAHIKDGVALTKFICWLKKKCWQNSNNRVKRRREAVQLPCPAGELYRQQL